MTAQQEGAASEHEHQINLSFCIPVVEYGNFQSFGFGVVVSVLHWVVHHALIPPDILLPILVQEAASLTGSVVLQTVGKIN